MCSKNNCYLTYLEQTGNGYPIFRGRLLRRQRGFGLFGSIARFIIPVGKKLVKTIAPKVLSTVGGEVSNVISGKSSIKKALKNTGKSILKNTAEAVKKEVFSSQKGGQLSLKRRETATITPVKCKRYKRVKSKKKSKKKSNNIVNENISKPSVLDNILF